MIGNHARHHQCEYRMCIRHHYIRRVFIQGEQHTALRFGVSDSTEQVSMSKGSGKVFELSGTAYGRCVGHGGNEHDASLCV